MKLLNKSSCFYCNKKNLVFFMKKIRNSYLCNTCKKKLLKYNYNYVDFNMYHPKLIIESLSTQKDLSTIHRNYYISNKQNEFYNILNKIEILSPNISDQKVDKNLLKNMPNYTFSFPRNNNGNFISLDTETTGLHPKNNKIIEISLIKFNNFVPTECLTTLLHIEKKLSENITKLTSITDDMLKLAPNVEYVMKDFNNFIKGYNIIGYNLEFDLKFLYINGLDFFNEKRKFYDVLQIARKKIKKSEIYDYKLSTVTEYCNIYPSKEHRATEDALCTGLLFKYFCNEI